MFFTSGDAGDGEMRMYGGVRDCRTPRRVSGGVIEERAITRSLGKPGEQAQDHSHP